MEHSARYALRQKAQLKGLRRTHLYTERALETYLADGVIPKIGRKYPVGVKPPSHVRERKERKKGPRRQREPLIFARAHGEVPMIRKRLKAAIKAIHRNRGIQILSKQETLRGTASRLATGDVHADVLAVLQHTSWTVTAHQRRLRAHQQRVAATVAAMADPQDD
jgi:hypothetical protein